MNETLIGRMQEAVEREKAVTEDLHRQLMHYQVLLPPAPQHRAIL